MGLHGDYNPHSPNVYDKRVSFACVWVCDNGLMLLRELNVPDELLSTYTRDNTEGFLMKPG